MVEDDEDFGMVDWTALIFFIIVASPSFFRFFTATVGESSSFIDESPRSSGEDARFRDLQNNEEQRKKPCEARVHKPLIDSWVIFVQGEYAGVCGAFLVGDSFYHYTCVTVAIPPLSTPNH